MNESVLIIAAFVSSVIGSPLVEGIKAFYKLVTQKTLEGKPALWTAVGVSAVLGLTSVALAGVFSPPYPADWQGWVTLVGGTIGAIFGAMTVVFKQLISK